MKKCVIIGSGLGGLACGCILSKNGYEVTVLEQGDQIGGCLQCFRRGDALFDTGMHYIGSAEPGQVLDTILQYLDVSKDIRLSRLNPLGYDVISFLGEHFRFANGKENFINALSEHFPKSRDELSRYYDLVKLVASSWAMHSLQPKVDLNINAEYQIRSVNEVIDSIISDPVLRQVLVGILPLYAGEKDHTPFSTHALISDFYEQSAFRIVGGSSLVADSLAAEALLMDDSEADMEDGGIHKQLKTKFIDGNVGFMSLVALALVLGLAFCIERIIYLTMSEIKAHKLMEDIEGLLQQDDVESAKQLCRNTRGPVASVCYQGLLHIKQPMDAIERSIANYGGLQAANLEKGCSWIKLFIAMAPSLGFLGTVIGMVMAFDKIQQAGDIGPTIVAQGMKVALITTIFGIVVALILQLFYSYILSKIERLTAQMEEAAITLLDLISVYKQAHHE